MRSPELDRPARRARRRRLQPQDRGRPRPLHRVLQVDVPRASSRSTACAIVVDGAHGAAYRVGTGGVRGARRQGHRDPHQPERQEHQRATPARCIPQAMCEAVRQHDAHLGVALDGDARSLRAVRRARHRRRRRRGDGAVRDPDARGGHAREEHPGHHGDVEHRARARAAQGSAAGSWSAPRSAIATSSRRCGARLQLRRRAVRPPRVPRSRDDRGRHRRRAPRARDHGGARASRCRSSSQVMTRTPQVLVNLAVDRRSRSISSPRCRS